MTMSIISHAVLLDTLTDHVAIVDYRPPCLVETLSAPANLNWSWRLQFADGDQDGRAELLIIGTSHRMAPHAGEPSPNGMRRIIYPRPCSIVRGSQILVPDPHGTHEDRVFTDIRRPWWWSTRRRLSIVMRHVGSDITIDIPDIPVGIEGGGLKR
jgi:hypothetical protein